MRLILLGAPGAGKGTQAEILSRELGIPTISTGNILRAAMKAGTPVGVQAKSYVDAGKLVPDEVIIDIIRERLAQDDCKNGYILDGVPRTIPQAVAMEEHGIEIDVALSIEIEDEVIIKRMSGRRTCKECSQTFHIISNPPKVEGVCDFCGGELSIRKDDAPDTVMHRLEIFHQETEPVKHFYADRGKLKMVENQSSIEATTAVIKKLWRFEMADTIYIKSKSEIEIMRQAGKITAGARSIARQAVASGVTTKQIDKYVHEFIVKSGAKASFLGYAGFPASACVSVNEEVIHGIPGKRVIHDGDIVSLDVGATYKGMVGDCAGTFPCGEISDEAKKLIEVTRQSFFEGIRFAREGYRISDIGGAIQDYVESHGYSVVREYVGHGVGHNMHEAPEVPNYRVDRSFGRRANPRLVKGMTIAVEPMVNIGGYAVKTLDNGWTVVTADGSLSAHYENTILITDGEPEILTMAEDL